MFCFAQQYTLSRAAVNDLLRMPSHVGIAKTAYLVYSLVDDSFGLKETRVSCCRNGRMAFTGDDKRAPNCNYRRQSRLRADGREAHHNVYWDLAVGMVAMLEDETVGTQKQSSMAKARAAAGRPVTDKRDWYDGDNFRRLAREGHFPSSTWVASSITTDGFEAWRQKGFYGWPVVATVLNLNSDIPAQTTSQILLCVTPGSSQPNYMDSFLRPIAAQLSRLSRGIRDVSLVGSTELCTLRGKMLHIPTNKPGASMLTNMTGHQETRPR